MQCPFCERNELIELMRNEHGNIAYDCAMCGVVHKSEFPEGIKEKMLVYRVKMDDCGFLYSDTLKDMWETIENTFFGDDKATYLDMPRAFEIDTVWMEKTEYDTLEPFEL